MIGSALAVIALTGATVFTGSGEPLENATVLIDGERIAQVGRELEIPEGAEVVELEGAYVTPGLIDAGTRLGLEEVGTGVPLAVEGVVGSAEQPVSARALALDGWNPRSIPIPMARAAGVLSAVVLPRGGVIQGQSAWVDLDAQGTVRRRNLALHVRLGPQGRQAGSRGRAIGVLRGALEDARLFRSNRGAYIRNQLRDLGPSAADLEILARALDGELRVVIEVDRAADILTALAIARDQRLDAVLLGAREGWLVADAIARAEVPVLVDPFQNLPANLDSLQSRGDNALRLIEAGCRVAFTSRGGTTLVSRLRLAAGNAVARGVPYARALAAITSEPAQIFGMVDAGTLRPGALAHVVVWNGDPLEPLSWPTQIYLRGERIDPRTHQDALTERYRTLPERAPDARP